MCTRPAFISSIATLIAAMLIASQASAQAQAPAPESSGPAQSSPVTTTAERAAASYSLGLSFATQWRGDGLDGMASVDELVRGIRAGLGGAVLTPEDRERANAFMREVFQALASRNEVTAGDFLAKNATAPGVKTTASGLQYQILKKGEAGGAPPKPFDRVTVQYRGHLLNGYEFDSTYARGRPSVVHPNDVIAGWREALAMMSKGSQWRLFVPPSLAYAMTPPPSIPPNSLLIFDVELVGIEPGPAPRASSPPTGAVSAVAGAPVAASGTVKP